MTYPTATELLFHKSRVLRRDAAHCMNVAADLVRDLLHGIVDEPELRQRAKTEVVFALANARRYAFEARIHGHKLPG